MARGWLGQWQGERARLKAARDRALEEKFPISQRRSELRRERASLEGRAGRVPVRLDELRSEVAAASGLSVEELPFLAELIAVAPEEGRWRTAIDTVLGATARPTPAPAATLAGFSRPVASLRPNARPSKGVRAGSRSGSMSCALRSRPRPASRSRSSRSSRS